MKLSGFGVFAALLASILLSVSATAQPSEFHCVSSGAQFRTDVVLSYDRLIQSFLKDPTASNKDLGSVFGVLLLTDALVDTSLRPDDLQIAVTINSANQATVKIETQAYADAESKTDQQMLGDSIGKMILFRKEGQFIPNKKEITAANLSAIKAAVLDLPTSLHLTLKTVTTQITLSEPLFLASEANGGSKIALYQAMNRDADQAKIIALGTLPDGSKLVIKAPSGKSSIQNRQMICQVPIAKL